MPPRLPKNMLLTRLLTPLERTDRDCGARTRGRRSKGGGWTLSLPPSLPASIPGEDLFSDALFVFLVHHFLASFSPSRYLIHPPLWLAQIFSSVTQLARALRCLACSLALIDSHFSSYLSSRFPLWTWLWTREVWFGFCCRGLEAFLCSFQLVWWSFLSLLPSCSVKMISNCTSAFEFNGRNQCTLRMQVKSHS
jgi:hypothetical protein